MSQVLCLFFVLLGGRCRGPVTKAGFYGTEERRSVSQGDILDTSLNLILAVFHFTVPTTDRTCMQFSPPRERENAYTSVPAKGVCMLHNLT